MSARRVTRRVEATIDSDRGVFMISVAAELERVLELEQRIEELESRQSEGG